MKVLKILVGLVVMSSWANADEGEHQAVDNLKAHVHGTSELTIAIDGRHIEIAFESPAMNLLGFEHKAHSANDKATVDSAVTILKQHEKVLGISGSRCQLIDSSVDVASVLGESTKHNDHKTHEHHDGHDHHEYSQSETHSDISANYHFQCDGINKLSSIDVNFFKAFSGIHEINVMWLTETKQGAVTLTSENNTVSFK